MKNLPKLRKAIYGVAVAGAALAVGYGLLTETEALLWLGLFGATNALAFVNVDDTTEPLRKSHGERDYEGAPLHDDELGR